MNVSDEKAARLGSGWVALDQPATGAADAAEIVRRTEDRDGATEQAELPAGNASADTWRAYAVEQHGADAEQVAGMSRNDLREQYGPRPE